MELDVAMRDLAEHQHGVLTRAQARAVGASRDHLRRRLASPAWEAVTSQVIRLVGTADTFEQRCMAATLDAGPGAAVSHVSAAALWGLPGFLRRHVEVSRPKGRSGRQTALARLHEPRRFPAHHVTRFEGVAVTTMAKTVFDLAGVVHPKRAERALDNALGRRLTTLAAVRTATEELAGRGRQGSALMRAMLAERQDGFIAPESGLEARFLTILRQAGLALPERQRRVGGVDAEVGRVDFLYPARRLVIEIDSDVHHRTVVDRAADAGRDRALEAAGYRVVRIREDQVWHRPEEAVMAISEA